MSSNFQVTVKTSVYRGDHATDISIAIDVPSSTTVEQLVESIFIEQSNIFQQYYDVIEIRFLNKFIEANNE